MTSRYSWFLAGFCGLTGLASDLAAVEPFLQRVQQQHPDLTVDLGVGLYAFPMPWDYDQDGDLDLVVSCSDKPYNGVYLFENPGPASAVDPVFLPPKKLGPGRLYMTLSWIDGQPRILAGTNELPGAAQGDWTTLKKIYDKDRVAPIKHLRQNQWRYADYDGDGVHDLLVGHESWDDFGWFDKNDWWTKYDSQGRWHGGSAHGWVYILRNTGTNAVPVWGEPQQLLAAGQPVRTFGWPGPNLDDFDQDGDLDLVCGEFLDGLTYFENVGTRTTPEYASGRSLSDRQGQTIAMELQMINPVAVDWNGDSRTDLVVGDEDGRIALLINQGPNPQGVPVFDTPRYFRQRAADLKFGALASPCAWDWDGDGDTDILSGNTAGFIGFIENLSGPGVETPRWAAPVRLAAEDSSGTAKTIRYLAGPNGSIQGPLEAKWGYTTLSVADWDGNGLPDLVVNSIWGRIELYRNIGTRTQPKLSAAESIPVQWTGRPPAPRFNWWKPQGAELVTQWRTTPVATDWTGDGLVDLVMMDSEGYLALYLRTRDAQGKLQLQPPVRALCDMQGQPLRLNPGEGGRSGRRKVCVVDWDGDGKLDLLVNSRNANWLRQVEVREGQWVFEDRGPLAADNIEAHDVGPTTVDWNGDGVPDLLAGGEDGHFYYLKNTSR